MSRNMVVSRFSVAVFVAMAITEAVAFSEEEPGGDAESARLAIQEPDEYAWRLFLWINRQAMPGTAGKADPARASVLTYSDNTDVVWETWALASRDGKPEAEVFLANGSKPTAWDDLPRAAAAPKVLDRSRTDAHRLLLRASQRLSATTAPQFVQEEPENDEVRMNKATFDFVRDNYLYSRQGLAAAFQRATTAGDRDAIQFPAMAKEVKARWETIEESQKPRYHWRQIGSKVYGLRAFHIISKDLPMWFWTDFIHVDMDAAEPDPCHDTTTRGLSPKHGHDGIRAETIGSKWENYRLKGTQVAFTDARGRPTILGNQLLEFGNARTSSCITCHAGAGVTQDGSMNIFDFIVGAPPATVFGDSDHIEVLQLDFLYSVVIRAHNEPPPVQLAAATRQEVRRKRVVEGFSDKMAARLALRQRSHALTSDIANAHGMSPRSLANLLKRWPIGATVTVAFNGGSTSLHRQIAEATRDWTNVGNIQLDFGYNAATDKYRTWSAADTSYQAAIRISFDQAGYWSNVGRDSRDATIAGPGEASMNFEDFAIALPSDWRGVVLHEFGHALGFEHEHQSPAGNCNAEFRWDDDPGYVKTTDSFGQYIQDSMNRRPGLYTLLGGPPNNWNSDTVNFNLRQLPNSSAFDAGTFDRASIMKYFFEAWMFKRGESSLCYSQGENLQLSPLDIAGIKKLYPHNPTSIAAIDKQRAEIVQHLENLNAFPSSQLQQLR